MAEEKERPATNDAAHWLLQIERAQSTAGQKKWQDRCEKIRKRYRYESSTDSDVRRYQMLWSNIETLKPAIYTQPPKPVVSRRWKDKSPVARVGSEMLERAISLQMELNDFNSELEQVRDDFLLYARGQARVKYEPVFDTVGDDEGEPDDGAVNGPESELTEEVEEAGDDAQTEILSFENVKIEYLHRGDFVHEASRTWRECGWVAFRAFMGRDDLVKRFGEKGEDVQLEANADRVDKEGRTPGEPSESEDKGAVWEIWDKRKRRIYWVAKGVQEFLEEGKPYLKLEGFFPCPKPAFGTITNDSLDPVPDFTYYKDQVEEIDTLTARIGTLQQSLKLVGFYPAGPQGEGSPEIENAVRHGTENRMIAVSSWAMFKEGGSGGAPIVWLPVEQVIKVLQGCIELRKQLIDDVYQITGISDIMRGDSDPNETKGAQTLKANFSSSRVRERQKEIARFCRDVARLTGEIICTQFQPETLMAMTGMQLPSDAEIQQQQLMAQQQALIAQAQAQQQQAPQMGQASQGAPAPMMGAPA